MAGLHVVRVPLNALDLLLGWSGRDVVSAAPKQRRRVAGERHGGLGRHAPFIQLRQERRAEAMERTAIHLRLEASELRQAIARLLVDDDHAPEYVRRGIS